MVKKTAFESAARIEKERSQFTQLLAINPNYFGNLAKSPFKPVKKIVGNTKYEQLTCIGFNQNLNRLEATIQIKLPTGYGGDLCHAGTTEYIRFFLDYGGGWEDAGVVGVNVHNLPNKLDCAKHPDKPITYVVTQQLEPKRDYCSHPVLPKVRAILSWNTAPPANPNWPPVWGNVLERYIQIKPRPWFIADVVDLLSVDIGKKLVVPPQLEEVQFKPIPLPDPPPFALPELVKYYGAQATARSSKGAAKTSVETHRFGLQDIHAVLIPGAIDQEGLSAKSVEWKSLGLDLPAALGALQKTSGNVTYEQLECLGLDYNQERLVATIHVKKPTGYSGDLCHRGSKEYVAFWADWDDTCQWSYLGTASVDVHDVSTIPATGLHYAAILPVDLTYHRRSCKEPKIGRIRAVLSWAVAPSTTNPDVPPYWGNRLDAHVQIKPGPQSNPGEVKPVILVLGGIPVSMIDPFTGMTTPTAAFEGTSLAPDGLGRPCPFGRRVNLKGLPAPFPGLKYRVQVHRVGDPPGVWTSVVTPLVLERADTTTYTHTAVGDFFDYKTYDQNVNGLLALWDTGGDDLWEIKLEISGVAGVDTHLIQLDNTAPTPPPLDSTLDIHITLGGGDCADFVKGTKVTGTFVARDINFGHFQLSTLPNTVTTPSNSPSTPGLISTQQTPIGGSPWELDTANPISMKRCGYVVLLEAWDRSILNSASVGNYGRTSVGLCLREDTA